MDAARRGRWLLGVGAGLGLALAAYGTFARSDARGAPGPGEAARVNGVAIPRVELERALARIEADTKDDVSGDERRHVLERLIDEELLIQRGVALGLVESDGTVRKSLASAVIASVLSDASAMAPSFAELASFYEANRGYFAAAGRVRVSRVFVRDGAGADARVSAALAALDAGVAPGEVARELGDTTPLELPDALLPAGKLRELLGPTEAAIALALAPGRRSDAIATGGGRAILISLERAPGSSPELEAVRAQVEAEWSRRAGARARAANGASLRREAEIRRAADAEAAK
ncbi:MAG: peptidyl-prolyl cis-trans isomerase [Myxococcota bacterium]